MAREVLDVVIRERGAKQASRNINSVAGSSTKATGSLRGLAAGVVALGTALAGNRILRTADEFTNLQNRIRVVTDSERELVAVTSALLGISQRTRTEIQANAELYSRMSIALADTDISMNRVLNVTEAIATGLTASGIAASEASGGLLQLSQALASGELRGDEFRSVAESMPPVLRALQRELGKTTSELRAMSREGGLTTDVVFGALENQLENIREEFDKTTPTLGQRTTQLRNVFLVYIGTANEVVGATTSIGDSFGSLTGILPGIIVETAGFAVDFVNTVTGIADALGVFIINFPAALTASFLGAFNNVSAALEQFIQVTIPRVLARGIEIIDFTGLSADAVAAMRDITDDVARDLEANGPSVRIDFNEDALNLSGLGDKMLDALITPIGRGSGVRNRMEEAFFKLGNAAGDSILGGIEESVEDKAAKAFAKLEAEFDKLSRTLDPTINATEKYNAATDLLNESIAAGLIPSVERQLQLFTLLEEKYEDILNPIIDLRTELEKAAEADLLARFVDPFEALAAIESVGRAMVGLGTITEAELTSALAEAEFQALSTSRAFNDGLSRAVIGLRQDFTNSALQMEGVMVNAFRSAEDALVDFVTTGKLEFASLVNSILRDLARMAIQQSILAPITGALGGILPAVFGGASVAGSSSSVSSVIPATSVAASAQPVPVASSVSSTTTGMSFTVPISVVVNTQGGQPAEIGTEVADAISREFKRTARDEFRNIARDERRPGGMLTKTTGEFSF